MTRNAPCFAGRSNRTDAVYELPCSNDVKLQLSLSLLELVALTMLDYELRSQVSNYELRKVVSKLSNYCIQLTRVDLIGLANFFRTCVCMMYFVPPGRYFFVLTAVLLVATVDCSTLQKSQRSVSG